MMLGVGVLNLIATCSLAIVIGLACLKIWFGFQPGHRTDSQFQNYVNNHYPGRFPKLKFIRDENLSKDGSY